MRTRYLSQNHQDGTIENNTHVLRIGIKISLAVVISTAFYFIPDHIIGLVTGLLPLFIKDSWFDKIRVI